MSREPDRAPTEGREGDSQVPNGGARPAVGNLIDRRKFMVGAGTLAGAAALEQLARAERLITIGPGILSPPAQVIAPAPHGVTGLNGVSPLPGADVTFLLRRREDFLFLQVDGYNLEQSGDELRRKHTGDAFIVFTFPPQHVFEQAYVEGEAESLTGFANAGSKGNQTPPAPGKSAAQLAYPSRLAFLVPRTLDSIPYSVEGLLTWSSFLPNVLPAAVESGGLDTNAYPYAAPLAQQTSIELPWRLVISPSGTVNWSHPTDLLTANGSTELWHTRLANGTEARADDGGTFRGVWTFDYVDEPNTLFNGEPVLTFDSVFTGTGNQTQSPTPPADNPGFNYTAPMNAADRFNIVQVTSNSEVPGRLDVQANRLWLSARGGLLDSFGVWDVPNANYPGYELKSWRHVATLGRDQYVKVVEKGYLFPFGHAVTMTTISERQFQQSDSTSPPETLGAFRQIIFVTVRQHVMSYGGPLFPNDSRDFPFRELTLVTERTGYLDAPRAILNSGQVAGDAFFPTLVSDNSLFQWHMIGTDWIGRKVSFTVPAVFVSAAKANSLAQLRSAYNSPPDVPLANRTADLQGQTVAFGEQYTSGDTDLKVQQIIFGAGPGKWPDTSQAYGDNDLPSVSPSLLSQNGGQASVRLSAAEAVSGGASLPGASTPAFSYYKHYVVDTGFGGNNVGNVFMESAGEPANMVFSGGSGGGIFTPNIAISGLSRSLGPVAGGTTPTNGSGLDALSEGTFDPTAYFSQLTSATILGGISLSELLQQTTDLLGGSPVGLRHHDSSPDAPNSDVPQISYSDDGTTITVNFSWTPAINLTSNGEPQSPNMWISSSDGSDSVAVDLQGTITTDALNPSGSTYSLNGSIDNFTFTLMSYGGDLAFIAISFDSLSFSSATGQSTSVTPSGLSSQFEGPLSFLNELEQFFSDIGDGGGPNITVTPTGITVDLTISIPPVECGFFTIAGISFSTGVDIPLDGSSMALFSFAFASQDDPFTISGGIFGGDGYFIVQIGTKHVQLVTVSIAFGAMIAFDIAVASGSISLTAGITFTLTTTDSGDQTVSLTAFVKLSGSLSVLGIISISITFDLSMTWIGPDPNSLSGTATLSVSISLFCFSTSVSMTATKTFASGGGSGQRHPRRHLDSPGSGSPPPFALTFGQQMDASQWNTYVTAFETA